MKEKSGTGIGVALSILSLIIGLAGIAMLIGVGEATNNTITAFAAVSFPFALFAGFFSYLAPRARWAIAICMCVPIAVLGIMGSWSSSYIMPGTIGTIALTFGGAWLGAWLRFRNSGGQQSPPANPPAA